MINYNAYKILSVKSRVAYCLVCLDALYAKYGISKNTREYKYLSNIVWFFLELDPLILDINGLALESSYEFIVRMQPRVYFSREWEIQHIQSAKNHIGGYIYNIPYIKNKGETFRQYYLSLLVIIQNVYYDMQCIMISGFEAGGDESNNDSGNTFYYLTKIIDIMCQEGLPLPSIEPFKCSIYSQREGLGERVAKRDIESYFGKAL